MKTLAALVSGFGWHVADLQRAAGRLGVTLHAVPFAEVSASVGIAGQVASVRAGGLDLMDGRRRPGADDAAGQPGTGRLPDGRPAPARPRPGSPCSIPPGRSRRPSTSI